jgi:hypothetical protein
MRCVLEKRKALLVLFVVVLIAMQVAPNRLAYRAVRAVGRVLPAEQIEGIYCSENFQLLLTEDEPVLAQAMLGQLERGLADLRVWLPDQSPKPIVVRLHGSQESLQQVLGGHYAPTVGAYYLGRLELLAPEAWRSGLGQEEALAYYEAEGPVVHELTHLLLDYQAVGKYPIWFSEGLAQYWEMRLRGYVWQEGGTDWRKQPHSLADIDRNFTVLPEAIAYQEALSLVQFMYTKIGEEGMQNLILDLGQGKQFLTALQEALGLTLTSMEYEWQAWLLR